MRVLVIDSHKSTTNTPTTNLHWLNARTIADMFQGDLIWSYKGVNDEIRGGYDAIVFVHASHYAYTDFAWLEASPRASLFYVTNEYNLGEPRTLWMAAKQGRKYTVIANHPVAASKVVQKYVSSWHSVDLNALCYTRHQPQAQRSGGVYYGSFRKDRIPYYQQFLADGRIAVSTHAKNAAKFEACGVRGPFIPRLNIAGGELGKFASSLYIEDATTHEHYNHLANRFYEAISWGVMPVFADSCEGTLRQSGLPMEGVVMGADSRVCDYVGDVPEAWHQFAAAQRCDVLNRIRSIVEATS